VSQRSIDTAVILFAGDARREERAKGLPPRFLHAVRAAVLGTLRRTPDIEVIDPPRGAGSLAGQIENALSSAFAAGYRRVILLAADVPGLSSALISEASLLLAGGKSAVIGGSGDGGFYLAGFNAPPGIDWREVALCTERACASLAAALRTDGWQIFSLPEVDDIDSLADARRVARRLNRFPALQRKLRSLLALSSPTFYRSRAPLPVLPTDAPLRGPPPPVF
jgi:glycosyltransferase A (GT-A) superfamily protein (DUF2064 family)